MIFSSYYFIFWFLPLTLLFYHGALLFRCAFLAKLVLLSASLIFYSLWKAEFLPIFLATILLNYFIARRFQERVTSSSQRTHKESALMGVGLIGNFGLLFYYKYLAFFAQQANLLFGTQFVTEKIIMPLGISFFTFMQMSYLFESYQGRVKERTSLIDYLQFITFFPHLIAGPIILHKELIPQFNDPARMRFIPENVAQGIFLFAIGLFKKVVIADSFAEYVTIPFDTGSAEAVRAWPGALGFTLQLYFDFSGYMDMAMGMAKMINFDLPINFDSPFRATNISAFWRRWHMTMTRFFMSYVFMPLAIRAARKHADNPTSTWIAFVEATAGPILLTFLLAGIWHGAGWTFIVFGLWHGVGLVVHRLWEKTGLKLHPVPAWILTFLFVVIGFVFFRAPNLANAALVIGGLFGLNELGMKPEWQALVFLMLPALALTLLPSNSQTMAISFQPSWRSFIFTMLLFSLSLFLINRQTAFLYWQF